MDEMTAFDRQIAREVVREAGPSEAVDGAEIFAAVRATQSPKWRLQSLFSATKFVVAGAILALFGGFLLAGALHQSHEQPVPPGATSASTTLDATTASDESVTPDLLPGVDLVTEQFEPGVYRVLSDGVRDLSGRIHDVTITPNGDVWVELGAPGDWSIVRLGEPGVSEKLGQKNAWDLGSTAGGAPVVESISTGATRLFDGESWQQTELSDYDACSLWSTERPALGVAGDCYTTERPRFADDETLLVRIEVDGARTDYTRADLGLGPEQNWLSHPLVGPDGTIWATVLYTPNGAVGFFEGLVRYDGTAWSFIPYDGDDAELCGICFGSTAVDEDGVVWVSRQVGDAPSVLAWDGLSWRMDVEDQRGLLAAPWGGRDLATAPDGSAWTVVGQKLYVVTPEAVAAAG